MNSSLCINGEADRAKWRFPCRAVALLALPLVVGLLFAGVGRAAEEQKEKSASPSAKTPGLLKYGDGKADGKKSLGGNGEMIRFSLPAGAKGIRGLKIHGSRYGYRKPPNEDFEMTFLSEDLEEILHTETAPYRLFKRGKNKWVRVKFDKPVELPEKFWIVLDFNAERTKGVYVSYDTSTEGKHSRIGLPGSEETQETDFKGDWMVQAFVAK